VWLGERMVDTKPAAGTVSLLASKFGQMNSSKNCAAVVLKPKDNQANSTLGSVIDGLLKETSQYDNAKLLELVLGYH